MSQANLAAVFDRPAARKLTPFDLLGQTIACAISQEDAFPLLRIAPYGLMQQECLPPGSGLRNIPIKDAHA